jgi:rare lipoprotein A
MDALSAAHPTLPMPCYARVTNLSNGKSLVVRVNDRGPYTANRLIDLSHKAAELLDFKGNGVARVRVEYVGRAPLEGSDDRQLMATLRTRVRSFRRARLMAGPSAVRSRCRKIAPTVSATPRATTPRSMRRRKCPPRAGHVRADARSTTRAPSPTRTTLVMPPPTPYRPMRRSTRTGPAKSLRGAGSIDPALDCSASWTLPKALLFAS